MTQKTMTNLQLVKIWESVKFIERELDRLNRKTIRIEHAKPSIDLELNLIKDEIKSVLRDIQ